MPAGEKGLLGREWKGLSFLKGRVKAKQLVIFTRELATLLSAGLPLLKSLSTLHDQLGPGPLKETVASVSLDVERGDSFSEALSKQPKVFPKLFVNMVKAGEAGGVLEGILKRLVDFLEKQQRLYGKVKSALMYPVFVLTMAVLILILLLTFVIPTFTTMFSELGEALPLPTRALIAISSAFRYRWYAIILVIVGLVLLYRMLARNPATKARIDRLKFQLPLFGPLIQKIVIARFSRTMGTLLASGVPILTALEIVKDATGNEVIANAIGKVHSSVKEGESVARPLEESGVFPSMVVKMVNVGEETGELDSMLIKVADTYEEEIDETVSGLTSLMEPVLIVVLGLIVGFIVIAMFLPLFTLAKLM